MSHPGEYESSCRCPMTSTGSLPGFSSSYGCQPVGDCSTDDPELSELQSGSNSLKLRDISLSGSENLLTCDMSTGTICPVVPDQLQRTCSIFEHLHLLSHLGIRALQHLVTTRYVWPGINKNVRWWAKTCIRCQQSKIYLHIITPLSTFVTPDAWFDTSRNLFTNGLII